MLPLGGRPRQQKPVPPQMLLPSQPPGSPASALTATSPLLPFSAFQGASAREVRGWAAKP